MRSVLRNVLRNLGTPEHAGLAYEVWADGEADTGKLADDRLDGWLESLDAIRVSADYAKAFERWKERFADGRSQLAEMTLASRLLVGHGNTSATDVGLILHRTWGVPMIPGSALKGLLAHYLETVYGPEVGGRAPDDPGLLDDEKGRARFQGVTWRDRRIVFGPGEVYGALFRSPDAEGDNGMGCAGAVRGGVVFHDALYVPASVADDKPLASDVLTVHQKCYYDRGGGVPPSDYDSPNPVRFLTVRPGTRFLIALTGPGDWTSFALDLLKRALMEWGVGGKTSLGYGRASAFKDIKITKKVTSEVLDEFTRWLEDRSGDTARQGLKKVRTEWLDRLKSLSLPEREAAAERIRTYIRRSKIAKERDQLIAELVPPAGKRPV